MNTNPPPPTPAARFAKLNRRHPGPKIAVRRADGAFHVVGRGLIDGCRAVGLVHGKPHWLFPRCSLAIRDPDLAEQCLEVLLEQQ